MTDLSLTERVLAVHRGLRTAGLPHAFGGALALAYCTAEPRGTRDIDVNVFVEPTRLDEVLAALPGGVVVDDAGRTQLRRDGQARLWWDTTPVDLFLSNHRFHDRAEANRRLVPFAGLDDLPVLACTDLAVFKAFFARPKDAVDVAAMVDVGAVELDLVEGTVAELLADPTAREQFFSRVREFVGGDGIGVGERP